MKIAKMQNSASADADVFASGEPVLVTRHGKVSGLYVPLEDLEQVPEDLRHDLISAVGRYVEGALEEKGLSEEEILEDFRDFRWHRR